MCGYRFQWSRRSTLGLVLLTLLLMLTLDDARAQNPWRVDFPILRFRPLYWPMFGSRFEGRMLIGNDFVSKNLSGDLGLSLDLVELSNPLVPYDMIDPTPSLDHTVLSFGIDAYMWRFYSLSESSFEPVATYFLGGHISGNVAPAFIGEWRLRFGRVYSNQVHWGGEWIERSALIDLEVRPGESPATIRWRAVSDDAPMLETRFAGGVRVTWGRTLYSNIDISPSLAAEARLHIPSTNVAVVGGYELRGHTDKFEGIDLEHSLRLGARSGNSYGQPGIAVVARYSIATYYNSLPFRDFAGSFSIGVGIDY
jgi:hypothetical protein